MFMFSAQLIHYSFIHKTLVYNTFSLQARVGGGWKPQDVGLQYIQLTSARWGGLETPFPGGQWLEIPGDGSVAGNPTDAR